MRVIAFAPGRVNLIGEHTDYNQGLSLPFAISQGVTVVASALRTPSIEAFAADLGESDIFTVADPEPSTGWRAFVRGAVSELGRAGTKLPGARVWISGTVPRGAGLGSSAALEVALALALLGLGGRSDPDRIELAKLCSRIENEWVGARTGLLDQLTSLLGEADHALRIDFRSLEITAVPLNLGDWRFAVLDSGQPRANSRSGYNLRREECAKACELLGIRSLREATEEMSHALPDPLDRRARHVLGANARVDQAAEALRRGDLQLVGRLMDASHASMRDLYELSTPAVEAAVMRLRAAGAAGVRLMGGGFGGHVVGLMPPESVMPAGARGLRGGPGARVLGVAT